MLRRIPIYAAVFLLAVIGSLDAKEFRVAVLYWSTNIPGQVAMSKGLEAEVARINQQARLKGTPELACEYHVAGDGGSGIENQIKQMKAAVVARPDIIVVQPTDNAALMEPLRAANAAGIPVVAYDQYISGGKLAAYRTSDNQQAGYLDGEYIASKFPAGQKIRLILVEYPHVSSTVERVNGFLEALEQNHRPYQVMGTYSAVEPVGGRAAAAAILRDFPQAGSVDVVFTVNDGGGVAVVAGLAAAGRTEILVATVDGDPESEKNIRQKRLTVIDSAQFCGPLGAEAMKAAYALLTGEKPAQYAVVPVYPITLETVDQYPGWPGPIPGDFTKPWPSLKPRWQGELKIIKP